MLKSSGAAGAATLMSRILGFLRVMVYGHFMGTSWVADAFGIAFLIPNLFRRLLGEGALTAAFVPIFKAKEKTASKEELWRATNAVLCGVALVCFVLSLLIALSLSVVLHQSDLNLKQDLVVRLMRWLVWYVPMVCMAAVSIGILNARGWFFLPALGGATLNLVMIASVYFLAPRFGKELDQQIFGLALGVLVAGVTQVVFQVPALWKEGYRFGWTSPWADPTMREVAAKMAPTMLGVAAYQFNLVVTNWIAYRTGESIVSSFEYATRLMELPQGVFGISLATYLLTELSALASEKKFPEFRATLTEAVGNLMFLNMLASVLLAVLAEPIMRLLFQHGGRFDERSTIATGYALRWLAPGLLAFSMNNILARAFYALGDTRTPMRIGVLCFLLNILFVWFLLPLMRQGGLGLANTLSAVLNMSLLFYGIKRALPKLEVRLFLPAFLSVTAAGAVAGLVAWGYHQSIDARWGHDGWLTRAVGVFLPMLLATTVYWLIGLWLKLTPARDFLAMARRILGRCLPRGKA